MAYSGWIALAVAVGGYAASGGFDGKKNVPIPPSPVIPQPRVDEATADAENKSRLRQQIAGGIVSTEGTAGGGAGSMLNPGTMSGKSLLGQ